jgi:hypothetical protein
VEVRACRGDGRSRGSNLQETQENAIYEKKVEAIEIAYILKRESEKDFPVIGRSMGFASWP